MVDNPRTIDPNEVRFSQRSVSYRFRDGRTIDQLAEGLRIGAVKPAEVPPIRLVARGGRWFTLDNRRLEAFRRAGVEVPFREATAAEVAAEGWKFTTTNEGVSVVVRGQ
jgi:hypothetical protein